MKEVKPLVGKALAGAAGAGKGVIAPKMLLVGAAAGAVVAAGVPNAALPKMLGVPAAPDAAGAPNALPRGREK